MKKNSQIKQKRIINEIDKLISKGYPEEAIINLFEDKILKLNDAYLSMEFTKMFNDFSIKLKSHEQVVIDSKDPRYNYLFALNIDGADVEAHGKVVIDSKDVAHNYLFALNVEGADVEAHSKVIIDSKNLIYNYVFAKDIEKIDTTGHKIVLLESKSKMGKIYLNELNKWEEEKSKKEENLEIEEENIKNSKSYQKILKLLK